MSRSIAAVVVSCVVLVVACDGQGTEPDAATQPDGAAASDAGAQDASTQDASAQDAGAQDAGAQDAGMTDAGSGGGTPGCGAAPAISTGEWVTSTLDVGGATRDWAVFLPAGYDPDRRYPVVYQFHGCSDGPVRENNNVPVQRESGADAIHVRGRAVDRCWDTSTDGPDMAFFDTMVATIEATYCADPGRRFATGYSSGSFMSHRLACVRGDVLRAVATIGGGQGGRGCSGTVAALIVHDRDDGTVNISASEGARDAHVERNACGSTRTSVDPSPCETYDSCTPGMPVTWCETMGMGHSRQDGFAAPAFWAFLSSL